MSRLQRIESSGKLRVGVNPGFIPFSFTNETGERLGVDIQIGNRLAVALGVELEIAVTEGKAPQAEVQRLFPEATVTGYPSNEAAAEATFKGESSIMIHDEIFLKVWHQQNEDRVRFRMMVLDPPIKPDF